MRKALLAALLAALTACGPGPEKQPTDNNTPPEEQDPGLDPENPTGGPAYPEGPYGTRVGDVVRNFALYGFRTGSGSYVNVRLSDFYDADGSKNYKVMWINVAAGWCGPCRAEQPDMVKKCDANASKGLVCYTALTDNNDYKPADKEFIEGWGAQYKIKHALVHDGTTKWGYYFDKAATPMNMLVDTRTMKILYLGTGYDAAAIEAGIKQKIE
ncbi:MAG: TlpA family protein disulfide reductase [Myxococcales bacterium]